MPYLIKSVTSEHLVEYCKVPITFTINSILEAKAPEKGFVGFVFEEKPVEPFNRDFDEMGSPMSWLEFDLANWKFYIAYYNGKPIGAATLVMKSKEIHMLEGKDDLACLWDLRVHPEYRGKGIGSKLFQRAAKDAKENGCVYMKVETQSNNVLANKFYESQGCHLALVHLDAYYNDEECRDEAMMVWYLDLKK